jgi:hypothetical protein
MLTNRGHDLLLALAIRSGDPVVARFEVRVVLPEGFPVAEKDGGAAACDNWGQTLVAGNTVR